MYGTLEVQAYHILSWTRSLFIRAQARGPQEIPFGQWLESTGNLGAGPIGLPSARAGLPVGGPGAPRLRDAGSQDHEA